MNEIAPTNAIATRLPAFLVVGGLGFVTDALILTLLVNGFGQGVYVSRLISFAIAVTVTWLANRYWTFRHTRRPKRGAEYARYVATQSVGAAINFGVYALVLAAWPALQTLPVIPLAIGSAIALIFNFLCASWLVFSHTPDSESKPS